MFYPSSPLSNKALFLLPPVHIIVYHLFSFKNDIAGGFLKVTATLLLIKHDGFGILVGHLSHVSQNVLLCDDTKKPPGVETKERKEVSLVIQIHSAPKSFATWAQGQVNFPSLPCGWVGLTE
jgi:hypothetical protein